MLVLSLSRRVGYLGVSAYSGLKDAASQERLLEVESSVSRDYCAFMTSGFDCTPRNRSKAIGQFLTPKQVYDAMIGDIMQNFDLRQDSVINVIDPFCGDGRLIAAFLTVLATANNHPKKVVVTAWDIDEAIINAATETICEAATDAPFEVVVNTQVTDAFDCDQALYGSFDICITNPPWSSTKSLKANAFATKDEYEAYQALTNAYGRLLTERYPEVKGGKSFGAGALNLSRFGLALALRLVKESGICGIVMPSSLAADTSSAVLRRSMLDHFSLRSLHYYPAELKLFAGADQAAIYLVLDANRNDKPGRVVSHLKSKTVDYALDGHFWNYSLTNGWIIPVGYKEEEIRLIEKLSLMPTLGSCGDITLGREVDETRISERLCDRSPYRFVKGFMVTCYRLSDNEKWYYDDSKSPIPPSAMSEKVVWRDVSRVSQKKRVKATLLSPGHVAGNSLGVATCTDPKKLRALLGVLNSSVFEFMARTVLTTNHVSSGMLKRVPYPNLSDDLLEKMSVVVDKILADPSDSSMLALIDDLVAEAYDLSPDELGVAQEAVNPDGQLVMEL